MKAFWAKYNHIIIGCFFLILQTCVFIANDYAIRFDNFAWFCAHTPILFALAFFFKNTTAAKALLNVGFIGQFFWTIDFLAKIIFNVHFLNITNYIFTNPLGYITLIPIAIHMFATNVVFFFTYKIKPSWRILPYTFVYIILLFLTTLLFTPVERNINCIYSVCGLPQLTFPGYTASWILIAFFIIALPTYGLQKLAYHLWEKRKAYEK